MKKVLIIAYIFPPSGGSGVQRTLKFVKYLPCYGWQPVVLTVKNPDSDYFDSTLLKDVPQGTVVRQTVSPNLVQYYKGIKGKKKSLCESADKSMERNNVIKRIFKRLKRVMSGVANNFLFIPDEYIGWLPFALWHGYRLIRKEQISMIYATGNPWTAFVIAKCLSAVGRVPYVIDFRDPWVLSAFIAKTERHTFKHRMSRMIEYSCIKNASCVINVNENITSIFKRYYKKIDSARFITITHGFDAEDFGKTNVRKNSRFVISHIGTLHANRTPDGLFVALSHIFELHSYLRTKIEMRLVGIINPVAEKSITNNNLTDVVKIIPYCSHKKSVEEMCSANLLFLIQGNFQGKKAETSPGKVFEYLASGTKILALVSRKNDAVKIIEGLSAGVAVEPDNVNLIAETILGYYKKWESGEAERKVGSDISMYSRKHLAGVLAKSFDNMCKDRL